MSLDNALLILGVLMDAQTVIAVCELLLVIVALIDLVGRRNE